MAAPFERGGAFGGSQRATTLAERLEERGATVEWATLPPEVPGRARRAASLASREPAAVRHAKRGGRAPRGAFDAVVAAHSYMAPHLESAPPGAVRMVDFHNLEWQHLLDVAALVRPPRSVHLRRQARLMCRFERTLVERCPLTLFTTQEELDWAREVHRDGRQLLVPNLLPRADERLAEEAWGTRSARRGEALVYVGKLTFPPNVLALLRFLEHTWPAVRAAVSGARLTVVGASSARTRAQIERHERVHAAGFVEDLRPVLADADAAVFPFEGRAGSSLRVLLFALAGVRVVGTPAAFRGIAESVGRVATTPAGWASAVSAALADDAPVAEARAVARSVHADPAPWDALVAELEGAAGRSMVGT